MPELPEVETVKRSLLEYLPSGVRWTAVQVFRKDLRVPFPKDLADRLVGRALHSIERRAKYLLFNFEGQQLLSHLGMSGSWRALTNEEVLKKHDHLIFEFDNGVRIVYHDPRRFGVVDWGGLDSPWLKHLGVEPFDPKFNKFYLKEKFKSKSTPIKVALMDAKTVVGIGNIYASEILFFCGISPLRKASRIKMEELDLIVKFTKKVLKAAIKSKGSTLRDHQLVNGDSGKFQNHFKVYARQGKPCLDCGGVIKAKIIGQRSTFWCPQCQK